MAFGWWDEGRTDIGTIVFINVNGAWGRFGANEAHLVRCERIRVLAGRIEIRFVG
jgi:hypothetical protein